MTIADLIEALRAHADVELRPHGGGIYSKQLPDLYVEVHTLDYLRKAEGAGR